MVAEIFEKSRNHLTLSIVDINGAHLRCMDDKELSPEIRNSLSSTCTKTWILKHLIHIQKKTRILHIAQQIPVSYYVADHDDIQGIKKCIGGIWIHLRGTKTLKPWSDSLEIFRFLRWAVYEVDTFFVPWLFVFPLRGLHSILCPLHSYWKFDNEHSNSHKVPPFLDHLLPSPRFISNETIIPTLPVNSPLVLDVSHC